MKTHTLFAARCRGPVIGLLLGFCVVGWGCHQDQSIEVQVVPKSRSGMEELRQSDPGGALAQSESRGTQEAAVSPDQATGRMVVGMYAFDDATWFFKLNGPVNLVDQSESQWRSFLESVQFDNGKPTWKLPEGWRDAGPRPMRFATLEIGKSTPPLQMAISSLGPDQDVLLNVNRWRRQMGVSAITESQLDDNIEKLDSDAKSAILFDVQGKFSGGMRPPFAGGMSKPPQASGREQASARQSGFQYDIPDDWESGRTSGMVPVRLKKTAGEDSVEITVVGLPAAANHWLPNVKRWAGQSGMSELTDEDFESRTEEVSVDGHSGNLVTLVPEDGSKAIVAAMVKRDGQAWFLKMTGNKSMVVESQDVFESFVKSLKFP